MTVILSSFSSSKSWLLSSWKLEETCFFNPAHDCVSVWMWSLLRFNQTCLELYGSRCVGIFFCHLLCVHSGAPTWRMDGWDPTSFSTRKIIIYEDMSTQTDQWCHAHEWELQILSQLGTGPTSPITSCEAMIYGRRAASLQLLVLGVILSMIESWTYLPQSGCLIHWTCCE